MMQSLLYNESIKSTQNKSKCDLIKFLNAGRSHSILYCNLIIALTEFMDSQLYRDRVRIFTVLRLRQHVYRDNVALALRLYRISIVTVLQFHNKCNATIERHHCD